MSRMRYPLPNSSDDKCDDEQDDMLVSDQEKVSSEYDVEDVANRGERVGNP